jgi:hypothetical protein
LWDDFIKEEMRLEMVSTSFEEAQDLALIRKVRKGGKKGGSKEGLEEEGRLKIFEPWEERSEPCEVL